jgi:uncharacterized protein YqcC (DUF446 family)
MWTFGDTTENFEPTLDISWADCWRRWVSLRRMARVMQAEPQAFSLAAWQESSCFCYWAMPPASGRCCHR